MHIFIAFVIVASLIAGFYKVEDQPEGAVNISVGALPGNVAIRQEIKPLSEFKNANVVRQMYDYSCGSAALATILNHYLGEDFSELQVINGLLKYGDTRKIIPRRGFSLLDMKRLVTVLGYKGVGYTAEIEDLMTLDRPCIIPLTISGFYHFAVFKGIYENHIFLADPSMGNISFTLSEFEEMWYKNVAFVVYPKGERGMDGP